MGLIAPTGRLVSRQVGRRIGGRLLGRMTRAVPLLGTLVAVAAVASTVRRKGIAPGLLDTALNAIPVVGGVKTVAETLRGRDFIRDRG